MKLRVCASCQLRFEDGRGVCVCGRWTMRESAYWGYVNAHIVHNHIRALWQHNEMTSNPHGEMENEADERAHQVARFYLESLQGEYFMVQLMEADAKGLI